MVFFCIEIFFIPNSKSRVKFLGATNSVTDVTITLTPSSGTNTFGRTAFRIHGGNGMGTASEGCIIINGVGNRREIVDSAYKTLLVR